MSRPKSKRVCNLDVTACSFSEDLILVYNQTSKFALQKGKRDRNHNCDESGTVKLIATLLGFGDATFCSSSALRARFLFHSSSIS